MKKTLIFTLGLALLLSLCACSREVEVVAEETPALDPLVTAAPAMTQEPAEPAMTQEPADSAAEAEALGLLLTDITDSVRPGSSGCSLRAVRCAAGLLDWAAACTMSGEQIGAAVAEWTAEQDAERLAIFTESLRFIADTMPELQGDNASDALDSAGVTGSGYPWSDAAYQTAQTVFSAAGVASAG